MENKPQKNKIKMLSRKNELILFLIIFVLLGIVFRQEVIQEGGGLAIPLFLWYMNTFPYIFLFGAGFLMIAIVLIPHLFISYLATKLVYFLLGKWISKIGK